VEEKMKMMELLKRIEQQSQEDNLNLLDFDEENADEGGDLVQRLGGVDVGKPCN
jgi:hypothetical protein